MTGTRKVAIRLHRTLFEAIEVALPPGSRWATRDPEHQSGIHLLFKARFPDGWSCPCIVEFDPEARSELEIRLELRNEPE